MAAFNTVTITGNDWVNLNTLSSWPAGTEAQIQNVSTNACWMQESATKPNINNINGGVLFGSQYTDLSKAVVAAGSTFIWIKLKDETRPVTLAVFE